MKSKKLIHESIYEILTLSELEALKNVVFSDPEFIVLNKRGNRMYSAGLNQYLKFARGEAFSQATSIVSGVFDAPVPVRLVSGNRGESWARSEIVKRHVQKIAQYKCEIDKKHETFISRSTQMNYMEGHHAIPMHYQQQFSNSLDVYANVICLCPTCHRMIHYRLDSERKVLLDRLYVERSDRLENCGIDLSRKDFLLFGMS